MKLNSLIRLGLHNVIAKLTSLQAFGSSASATGFKTGGYHLSAHSGKSKTFKANQRKEIKVSAKRKQRAQLAKRRKRS